MCVHVCSEDSKMDRQAEFMFEYNEGPGLDHAHGMLDLTDRSARCMLGCLMVVHLLGRQTDRTHYDNTVTDSDDVNT